MIGIRRASGFGLETTRALSARGVEVSFRGGALRISPHLYNEPGDIDRLFEELDRLA
jgi:selenocysteine lyase/cysteine desulfurase